MLEALGESVECPICFEIMVSSIRQCSNGHSICGSCVHQINCCPLCKAAITATRNFQLEHVIANIKKIQSNAAFCPNEPTGGKRKFHQSDLEDHQIATKRSNSDIPSELENHIHHQLPKDHIYNRLEFQKWTKITIDLTKDAFDMQLVPYNNGEELFWYKHKIDVQRKEVYWLFQYVEPKNKPSKYYYEFTLGHCPLQTMKIWESCESDRANENYLIKSGRCITIPFSTLRKYFNDDNNIAFKFKIVEMKQGLSEISSKLNAGEDSNNEQVMFPTNGVNRNYILPPVNPLYSMFNHPLANWRNSVIMEPNINLYQEQTQHYPMNLSNRLMETHPVLGKQNMEAPTDVFSNISRCIETVRSHTNCLFGQPLQYDANVNQSYNFSASNTEVNDLSLSYLEILSTAAVGAATNPNVIAPISVVQTPVGQQHPQVPPGFSNLIAELFQKPKIGNSFECGPTTTNVIDLTTDSSF